MSDDDLPVLVLRDLLAFADMAARLVARGRAAYDADETLRLAAEAVLHKIGEAVARLPDEFVAAHPEVPWRSMKGMRNIVAHAYEQVDYQIVWNSLERRLPLETQRIRDLLVD
ncbi:MAG TPA: HepT-like ribonuclease domain-containing protein [Nocardioidaceae bacterium]|nr:HepT-like ribonuclease domain-containing protein [Nocardioidaceae bacterium]